MFCCSRSRTANPISVRVSQSKIVSLKSKIGAETLVQGVDPGTYYLRIRGAAKGINRYIINLFVDASMSDSSPDNCGG
jgi:hypothetical protein